MIKISHKVLSIVLLIVILIISTYVSLVISATGYIRINATSGSASGQTVAAGGLNFNPKPKYDDCFDDGYDDCTD